MPKTLTKILVLAATLIVALPAAQALAKPKPKVQFSQSAYAVAENVASGYATITVVRPKTGHSTVRLAQPVSVDYTTSDGSAKAGVDYTATHGTLSFPACASGFTSTDPCVVQTFNVPIIDNSIVDGPRTVNLKLSNAVGPNGRAILGYPSSAVLVIADDEVPSSGNVGSTFQLAMSNDVVSESAGTESVFVIRSGDLSQSASVNYATADGSAKDTVDYSSTSGTLNFPNEATDPTASVIQAVPVTILHNPATDPQTSDFTFALSLPGGSTDTLGSPSSETVTIVNSDGTPKLIWSSPSYSVSEKGGSVRLTVVAAGSITGSSEVDVDYATANGTALAGVNYSSVQDTLQFFEGDIAESFDVPVMDDGKPGDKYFTAALSNATGGGVIPAPGTATVNVLNVDPAPPVTGGGTGGGGTTGSGGGVTGGAPSGDQGGQFVLGARQSACGLVVKAAKKQKLLKKRVLVLKLRAGSACKVAITAVIKQVRAKKHSKAGHAARALRFKGKKVSLSLQPGKAKTVKVRFSKKTLAAIRKALRTRKKLVASVVVTERVGSAPVHKRTLKITIRR